MLIEFTVGNYLSFKEPTTLSMVGMRAFKEHEDSHVIKLDDKLKLLKSAVVYGNNASGKSNLISAFGAMWRFVMHSFSDALSGKYIREISSSKFLLSTESEKMPVLFEIVVLIDGIKYRYGFEVSEDKVVSEWLFHTIGKEVALFTRDEDGYYINKSSFKEGLELESKTRDNVLFLTLVSQFNGEIANEVIGWFQKSHGLDTVTDEFHRGYTIKNLKEDLDFRRWVNAFVKFLEVARLDTSEEDEEDLVVSWHNKYDENHLLVDTIPFDFDLQESAGTQKLIYLLGPLYDMLKYGGVLFIDELDSRLHPNLVKYLLGFFHEKNTGNAQFIFAVHDTSILSKDYFRRDQICFVEKDQFGVSGLYSLGDFKSSEVRNKSAFDKNYVQGKYGAIPYFENDAELRELLYG